MKYYLRLTESDKFVKGCVYSEEFLNKRTDTHTLNTANWEELEKDSFCIQGNGTLETAHEILNFLCDEFDGIQTGPSGESMWYYYIDDEGLIKWTVNGAIRDHVITLPINQLKSRPEVFELPHIEMRKNHNTLGAHDPIYTQLYEVAKSLNLSYLDGKILESLTNKDYTKIIELCKTQLNN